MNIIRYLLHNLNTKYITCQTYCNRSHNFYKLKDILRPYHIFKELQTDNGFEFTNNRYKKDKTINLFNELCNELNITHHLIKPRTPRHNGKVEKCHRSDQKKFYSYLKFYNIEDSNLQMKAYLKK